MRLDALQSGLAAVILLSVGFSAALFLGKERSPARAILLGACVMVGFAAATTPPLLDNVNRSHPALISRFQGLPEAGAIVLFAMLILALARSSSASRRRKGAVRLCSWILICLGGWHAVASFAWPAQRLNDYEMSLGDPGVFARPGFWLFATFWLIVAATFVAGWSLLAVLGKQDSAEARRAQTAALSSVFAVSATAVPSILAPLSIALWICFSVYAHMQYANARAERMVFLSRFMSPRVIEVIATRGFAATMKPHHSEVTVVSADLRGFTSYSEGVPSRAVVDLLADYYDAVGEVTAKHNAAVTSYAGDGVMILVGAPIADPNHAATGIQLARELLAAVQPVLTHWQTRHHTLGLGVGVASGNVTVGAITAKTRMEYTGIGMPVNLAARLCRTASAGEILIDAEAVRLSNDESVRSRGEMKIKGFSDKQQIFAL